MSKLRRTIGPVQATAMVIGTIIGASIFVQPAVITGHVPSLGAVALVWVIAGLLTLLGALVTAELASGSPHTGGVYVFLRDAFSPAMGFLWGWAMFWSMHSGIIAALAVVFARYAGHFVALDAAGVRVVAIGAIAVLSAINYVGVRHGSRLQAAFTIGKVVAIVVIIAVAFGVGPRAPEAAALSPAAVDPWSARDFGLALVAGLFAFGGWHMVTYAAGETVEPERTIPRALVVGTLVVTACYVALNAAYLHVLPLAVVAASDRVAADAAEAVMGGAGASLVSGLVMFSTFGALSGIVLAGPRVYYAMARDGLLFRWAGATHPRFQTPHRAVLLQGVCSAGLVATGSYEVLFTRVIYTEWIFFGLMALGSIRLRRRASYMPRYRVWGYPVTPLLFAAAAFAIVVNQIIADPAESAVGLAVVVAGLPVYLSWTRHAKNHRLP